MTGPPALPPFLTELVAALRHHHVRVGVGDLLDLRECLRAGHGLGSPEAFGELCVALWATTPDEAELIRTQVIRLTPTPTVARAGEASGPTPAGGSAATGAVEPAATGGARPATTGTGPRPGDPRHAPMARIATSPVGPLPALPAALGAAHPALLLVPRHPTTEREVAQSWRRLSRPRREGPAVEVDLAATVARLSRYGPSAPPVLVPLRRNIAELVLLLDRGGSMTPYHDYVDHVVDALRRAPNIARLTVAHFHDLPRSQVDRTVLGRLPNPLRTGFDAILDDIPAAAEARVYDDPGLHTPRRLATILGRARPGAGVVVVSDAGAARGSVDALRQYDTLAFARMITSAGRRVVWLNPAPVRRWARSDAGRLARHVPMFPLTREGMQRAVDVFRGRPVALECPL